MFLFPYESVKKDSNVVIYGAGTMGTDYILQVQRTQYCNIIFALDRSAEEKLGFPISVYSPEYIKNVGSEQYDVVLIALQDVNHSDNIKKTLVEFGVNENKIIQAYEVGLNCAGFFPRPNYVTTDEHIGELRLAFYAYGGMGDTLIATTLIKSIRKLVKQPLVIDYYCNYPIVYTDSPFIDHVYKLTQFSDSFDYDFSAFVFRNIYFQKINIEKIRKFSKTLYEWCIDAIRINEKICDNFRDDCRYSLYAAMKGRNRIEQQNINGILPYDRYTPVYMDWDLESFTKLKEFGLENKKYITISSGIENCNTMRNPKLWETEKYNRVVSLIKQKYPDILVVNIGQNYNFGVISGVDIDLVGKTTLNDVKVVLKQSMLHIGVEGGLVHLNHFLNGKSCCMYGPTSKTFFGYPENINVSSGIPEQCSNGCEGIIFNWMSYGCFLNEEPVCMKTLTPELVFESIDNYLENYSEYDCRVTGTIKVSREELFDILIQKIAYFDKIAITNRINEQELNTVAKLDSEIDLFDKSVCIRDDVSQSRYLEKLEMNGIKGEFGNVYNLPASDQAYNVVINSTFSAEKYPEYVLKELLRITKTEGLLYIWYENKEDLLKALKFNEINVELLSDVGETGLVAIKKKKY